MTTQTEESGRGPFNDFGKLLTRRADSRSAIREEIKRLHNEADGLESLLDILDPKGNEDRLTPEAVEALWRLVIK